MSTLHHLIYSSESAQTMTLTSLVALLMRARANNERAQISGALVYANGRFMQVLEGEQTVVNNVYDYICQDRRHQNVQLLANEPISTRSFTQWSMAFGQVSSAQFDALQRVSEYFSLPQMATNLQQAGGEENQFLTKMLELVTDPK